MGKNEFRINDMLGLVIPTVVDAVQEALVKNGALSEKDAVKILYEDLDTKLNITIATLKTLKENGYPVIIDEEAGKRVVERLKKMREDELYRNKR